MTLKSVEEQTSVSITRTPYFRHTTWPTSAYSTPSLHHPAPSHHEQHSLAPFVSLWLKKLTLPPHVTPQQLQCNEQDQDKGAIASMKHIFLRDHIT